MANACIGTRALAFDCASSCWRFCGAFQTPLFVANNLVRKKSKTLRFQHFRCIPRSSKCLVFKCCVECFCTLIATDLVFRDLCFSDTAGPGGSLGSPRPDSVLQRSTIIRKPTGDDVEPVHALGGPSPGAAVRFLRLGLDLIVANTNTIGSKTSKFTTIPLAPSTSSSLGVCS